MTQFLVYDVFTDEAFGGNPLAVIPDATGLPDAALQKIAAEFNLSETTFVYPAQDAANTARVRIFTPTQEVPFAGHPTVGTALALKDLGRGSDRMVLELGVGPIPVEIDGNFARFETRVPLVTRPGVSTEHMADMVSLPAGSVIDRAHQPINASVGLEFLFAELADEDALTTASPNVTLFKEAIATDQMRLGTLLYVRRGRTIHARMFAPTKGIPEDPATGSAVAALAALLGSLDGTSQSFTIHQGVAMGRPSLIRAAVTIEDGAATAVTIGGSAVRVIEGRLVA